MVKESTLKNHRIEHEGKVWHIDGKIWPPSGNRRGLLKVYRIHGDVTDMKLFREAVELFTSTLEFLCSPSRC